MSAVIGTFLKSNIVGRYDRKAEIVSEVQERSFGLSLDDFAVTLQFDIKTVRECASKLAQGVARDVALPCR
mgnify:CR=1 FL=1